MFHHFHDDKLFLNSQGSINAYQFQSIINFVKKKVQILSPYDFKKNLKNRKPEKATCITFDDGLLSQYKIAKPVLDSLNIKAFFFVYSAIWDENFETPLLEFFRDFRHNFKGGIENYYKSFFIEASNILNKNSNDISVPKDYLIDCPFYTYNDKKYRFFRDFILTPIQYINTVKKMLDLYKYSLVENRERLFMSLNNLLDLVSQGHDIGLHSNTHPTDMNRLKNQEIDQEYNFCYSFLEKNLKIKPTSVSYPCGIFNSQTQKTAKKLNLEVGFAASLTQYPFKKLNPLLLPREDHINILKSI